MDKHWKTKWVKALKSGEYAQGKGCLKDMDTYCCLGVLCEIHTDVRHADGSYIYEEEKEVSNLMPSFLLELGITNVHHSRLINLNDGEQANFHQIADYIEKKM